MCRRRSAVYGYFAQPVLVGDEIVAVDRSQDGPRAGQASRAAMGPGCAKGGRAELRRRIEEELHRFERFQLARLSAQRARRDETPLWPSAVFAAYSARNENIV